MAQLQDRNITLRSCGEKLVQSIKITFRRQLWVVDSADGLSQAAV